MGSSPSDFARLRLAARNLRALAGRSRSRLAWSGAVALVLVGLWHALPVILWHGRFASQLAAEGDPERLHAKRWASLRRPSPAWAELFAGTIALRAPLAAEALPACGRCATACRLPLDNRGTLAVLDELPPASYDEALDHFAPDAGDISLLRSVARNWRTIDALTDRMRASFSSESFRFAGSGSRGVVAVFRGDGTHRYVVYAYPPDGGAGRVIGVAGLERARFEGLLGGLHVQSEHAGRPSTCSPEAR
jgi:hypothetical protein